MLIQSIRSDDVIDDYSLSAKINEHNRLSKEEIMTKSFVHNGNYAKSQKPDYKKRNVFNDEQPDVSGTSVLKTLAIIGIGGFLAYKYVLKPLANTISIVTQEVENRQKTNIYGSNYERYMNQDPNSRIKVMTPHESYLARQNSTVLSPDQYEIVN